jgi:hypothetical protein
MRDEEQSLPLAHAKPNAEDTKKATVARVELPGEKFSRIER